MKKEVYNDIETSLLKYVINVNEGQKDFIALNYLGKKIYFSEFLENVEKVKQAFIKSGIKENDVVSVLYLTTPETIYSLYALDEIGAAINFLNPIEPESIKDTIEEEKPKLVICYDQFYPLLKDYVNSNRLIIVNPTDSLPCIFKLAEQTKNILTRKQISLPIDSTKWIDFINNGVKVSDTIKRNENVRGVHLGSGGSSGLPKQIQLSSKLLNNIVKQHYLMSNSNAFNIYISRGEILLDVIPPHLGYGICDIHLSLSFGLELAIAPNPNPKEFVGSILKYKPNFILAGPVHWKEYNLCKKRMKTPYIKTVVSGGEKLEKEVEEKTNSNLKMRGSIAQVHEGVGLTEIAGVATYNSDPNNAKYTVGRPLPEYIVGIFKADLENEDYDNTTKENKICTLFYKKIENGEFRIDSCGKLGLDNFGEICYCLPIDIDGYIGKYAKENNVLLKKHDDGKIWIHTGDVGYIREDRNLVLIDRIKRVFNRNGFKVYPNALENIAQNSGMINECVVIPRKSADNSEANVPIMYVVLNDSFKDKSQQFIEYCKKEIVGNSEIYQYIFVDQLPRTGAGKKSFKYIQLYDSISYPIARCEEISYNTSDFHILTLKKMQERLN